MMATLPPTIRPRLAQLVRLLASPHDGEVVASARAIRRTLDASGLDLDDLAGVVERGPAERVVFRDRPAANDVPEWARPTRPAHSRPRPGDVVLDFGRRCEVVAALRRGLNGSTYTAWEVEFSMSLIGRLNGGDGRLSQKQAETARRLLEKLGEGSAWASV